MEQEMDHRLTMSQRSKLTLTGVNQVISFDDSAVVLDTCMGTLVIQGEQLQLKTLSLEGGQVAVEGKVWSLQYQQDRPAGGFFRRLFQ